jgi:DNA modification methylase
MVEVFREARRVLREDGTCWVNMGDCYATGAGRVGNHPGGGAQGANWQGATTQPNRMPLRGFKPKDLIGMPWRLAFALQEDGWWLRQDIIWSKPNPMPESARDRCTKAHEYIFLLTKSARYYFNKDANSEPCSQYTHPRTAQNGEVKERGDVPSGWDMGAGGHRKAVGRYGPPQSEAVGSRFPGNGVGFGHGYDKVVKPRVAGIKNNSSFDAAMAVMPTRRNKRSVWTMTTRGFKDAHFATFPPELVENCLKAGCPSGGTAMDIFGGAFTTALVASRLQMNSIMIELYEKYVGMGENRLVKEAPLLTELLAA